MADEDILPLAVREGRVIVTNDKDFGDLVYARGMEHRGIVLLRLGDERAPSKIAAMSRVLDEYADHIVGHFVVVTDSTVRISRT